MFSGSADKKSGLVKNAKLERELRLRKKKEQLSVVKIQACVRMFVCRKRFQNDIRNRFDTFFKSGDSSELHSAQSIFCQCRRLFLIYKEDVDDQRIFLVCKSIISNLDVEKEAKYWYMSVMLMKEWTSIWIKHIKHLLNICATKLRTLQTFISSGSKAASVYLTMLVLFTDCDNWKILKIKGGENIRPVMQQLCASIVTDLVTKGLVPSLQAFLVNGLSRTAISLNQVSLAAVTTLIVRVLGSLDESSGNLVFVLHILTVPAYVYHLSLLCSEGKKLLLGHHIYRKTLHFLSTYENMSKVYKTLNAEDTLSLIGNMINLCCLKINIFPQTKDAFKVVMSGLLNHCRTFLGNRSPNSKFHPILGWHEELYHGRLANNASMHVLVQLKYLWRKPLVTTLFQDLPSLEETCMAMSSSQECESKGSLLRRAFMKTFKRTSSLESVDLNEPVVADVCSTCDLYRTLAKTLVQLKVEIVAALSFQEEILVQLWHFIYSLGSGDAIKCILNHVSGKGANLGRPLSSLLICFCECAFQLIPILDDEEIYEKQKPYTCNDLVKMSSFLNMLVFKLIWYQSDQFKMDKNDDNLKKSALELLLLLHNRDCRRTFTPSKHWLIKELKISQFLNELKEKKERAKLIMEQIPHIIPHMERVKIFHSWVNADKRSLGIEKEYCRPSAIVSIHRSRLLEDGYEQLSRYNGTQLKGIIRVKFVNEQGLDEAGIDQDGVFKEFLEDVICKAFNPELNLFKMTTGTTEQRLYPSPTSFLHSNHLHLFEFVGKMLGKAVYEGILVDIPFASFFLNSILQRHQSAMHSSIDELPSLDPEMYKHLNFIKNYADDVSELELVFAYDEDVLGKRVTYDLKPGGRAISVNNANKFSYIHLMATFRIHTQIKEISSAFIRGFRSIISPEWLSIFSPAELQHLISGDCGNLDLSDLRNNTRYYGGYHSGHPTISWLWDILINDFTVNEKKMFFKFVTSCSNPPLLGFKYLEPQFSIRFVDCSEDDDDGDSVGSVVRGLFSVRKHGSASTARLPTASTCFNLLKLPSYKKKSILREKLRYAIKSGAGFELS